MIKKLLNIAEKSIAVIIICAAVLVGLANVLGPALNAQRGKLQYIASQVMKHPVQIGEVHVAWYGLEPVLEFSDVIVLNDAKTHYLLRLQEFDLGIKPLQSLFEQRFVPGTLAISGAHIIVRQGKDGNFSVDGINEFKPSVTGGHDIKHAKQFIEWLFTEDKIALHNFYVHWVDKDDQVLPIASIRLQFINRGDHHQILGFAELDQKVASRMHFDVNITGDVVNTKDWHATAYLAAKNVVLKQWFTHAELSGLKPINGLGNMVAWFTVQDQQLQMVQTQLSLNNFQVQTKFDHRILLDELSGNFAFIKTDHGWDISGDQISVVDNGFAWPQANFSINYEKQGPSLHQLSQFSYINLVNVTEILQASDWLPEKVQSQLALIAPRGSLEHIRFDYQRDIDKTVFEFDSQIHHFSSKQQGVIPGINNLSGIVHADQDNGSFWLISEDLQLDFAEKFKQAITLEHALAKADWQKLSSGIEITITDLDLENKDAYSQGEAVIWYPFDGSGTQVDMLASLQAKRFDHALDYMPQHLLPENVNNWIDKAIVSGDGAQVTLLLRGRLKNFPFKHDDGVFLVDSQLQNMQLHYYDNWPDIENIDANLIFKNQGLSLSSNNARIFNSTISNAKAVLPILSIKQPMLLSFYGDIQSNLPDGLRFLRQSPLKNNLGRFIDAVRVKGPMQLGLSLDIPLGQKDNKKPVKVLGKVQVAGGEMALPDWNLLFDKLGGKFHFTEEGLFGKSIKGELFNQPTTVSFNTKTRGQDKQTEVNVLGSVNATDFANYLPKQLVSSVKGSADYIAHLFIHHQAGEKHHLKVTSVLEGISIDLPEPLKKTANSIHNLSVDVAFAADDKTTVLFNHHKLISGALVYKGSQFDRGEVYIGNSQASVPKTAGMLVIGEVNSFVVKEWLPYLSADTSSNSQDAGAFRLADLWFNTFDVYGQHFDRLRLRITPEDKAWLFRFNGPDINGEIHLPHDIKNQAVTAHLKNISIKSLTAATGSLELTPDLIPNLSVIAENLSYGDKQLGKVILDLSHDKDSLLINEFSSLSDAFSFEGKGKWQKNSERELTLFEGVISSNDLAKTLTQWDMPPAIDAKEAGMAFNLAWAGKPYDGSLEKATGSLAIKLERGRITQLGEETEAKLGLGKLFSILSLQTLPRRLHLDFSDITKKGFSFDEMKGDFNLKNGNTTTDNTSLVGPVADVELRGRIGLADKDYDLKLKVLPHVTSSLPLVATIAGGPIAGIVTWAAEKVIGKEIGKITAYRYAMTGSWDKPLVTQLKR